MAFVLSSSVSWTARAETRHSPPSAKAAAHGGDSPADRLDDSGARSLLKESGIDPDKINCNSRVVWIDNLDHASRAATDDVAKLWGIDPAGPKRHRAARIVTGYMVRLLFEQVRTQNLGVMRLRGYSYRDARGRSQPLLVYRSAVTTDPESPGSCLRSLIEHGAVRHIVNLYAGEFPLRDFISVERSVCQQLGATHHDTSESGPAAEQWRNAIRSAASYDKNKRWAMERVAGLINSEILRPKGAEPQGNVYFHCAGGMHRSGILFGILRRCINGDSMALIEDEYKRHTAYRSVRQKGGYEALNLKFIRDFDCALLARVPLETATEAKEKAGAGAR